MSPVPDAMRHTPRRVVEPDLISGRRRLVPLRFCSLPETLVVLLLACCRSSIPGRSPGSLWWHFRSSFPFRLRHPVVFPGVLHLLPRALLSPGSSSRLSCLVPLAGLLLPPLLPLLSLLLGGTAHSRVCSIFVDLAVLVFLVLIH